MKRNIVAQLTPSAAGIYTGIKAGLNAGSFSAIAGVESFATAENHLNSIAGNESLISGSAGQRLASLTGEQKFSVVSAIQRALEGGSVSGMESLIREEERVAGLEGFSWAQSPGNSVTAKAASITLNALAHRQTDAAEAMFKTVSVAYEAEQLEYTVRTSGLGRYIFGASAYDSASQLQPVTSLLRKSKYFLDDTLELTPVYPAASDSPARALFVDAADFTPWEKSYSNADSLRRTSHLTSFLKTGKSITNLLGLSEVPGQTPFDNSTDEIEANSITVQKVLFKVTIGGTEHVLVVPTNNFTNSSFGVTSNGHSSDDRLLNMVARALPVTVFEAKDGTPTTAFDPVQAGGAKAYFSFTLGGTYNRQTNTISTNTSDLNIDYIELDGVKHNQATKSTAVKALFSKFEDGQVIGWLPTYNHNNVNRTNFGYRVEVFDAHKVMNVRRETPISVKYPVDKNDVNEESLSFAIEEMNTILQAQTTAKAYQAAEGHIARVASLHGHAIVGNEQSASVMAGMHFVNASYLNRKMKLADAVSALDSITVLEAVEKTLTMNITELCAALSTVSGLAAISEYRRIEKKWVIVGHQNLARYMIRQGDARTIGAGISFQAIESNLDEMIGKFYIFPESDTNGENIDVIGGMGVMVSKEHQVVQANLTRNNADFGIVITQPAYKHHSVCPIVGVLEIEDAAQAVSEEGLIRYLTQQRVKIVNADEFPAGGGETVTTSDADAGKLP
ncbi:capsid and scaffold protein [Vibrio phage phiKT1019]|nr:capsid and scaffold protein [Vibrio phage phiKT1019]